MATSTVLKLEIEPISYIDMMETSQLMKQEMDKQVVFLTDAQRKWLEAFNIFSSDVLRNRPRQNPGPKEKAYIYVHEGVFKTLATDSTALFDEIRYQRNKDQHPERTDEECNWYNGYLRFILSTIGKNRDLLTEHDFKI